MENSFGNCSSSTLDADGGGRFKNQLNSTALNLDDSDAGFLQPRTPPRVDLKFSPILRTNDDARRNVFSRRMALCKNRGESPLTKTSPGCFMDGSSIRDYQSNDSESGYLSRVNESEYESSKENDNVPETSTPKGNNTRINPFETRFIDSIHLNTLSPSIFDTDSTTSPKEEESAVLSIEARAVLMPVEITAEEARLCHYSPDPLVEARIHASLDVYWQRNGGYVPSPVSHGPRQSHMSSECHSASTHCESSASKARSTYTSPNCRPVISRRRVVSKRNSASQTQLTIAPSFDFDFQAILGSNCVYQPSSDDAQEDEFNVSSMNTSLPRRLFAEDSPDENDILDDDVGDTGGKLRCDLDDSNGAPSCAMVDFGLSPIKSDSE